MLLNGKERVVLLGILPNENINFITLKVVHDLRMDIALNDDEVSVINVDGGQLTKLNKVPEKDIPMGNKAEEIILDVLIKLDNENKLTVDHFPLCEKFKLGDKLKKLEEENTKKESNEKK